MGNCRLIEECIFFGGAIKDIPASADLYRDFYCRTENSKCARFTVYKALGKAGVPDDLFPNELARALKLVAEKSAGTNVHNYWAMSLDDLQDLTPIKARDLIVKCFFEAQKETLAQAEKKVFGPANEITLIDDVIDLLRHTVSKLNRDFNHPTKEDLVAVVRELAAVSASWGTPREIIEFHKKQILDMLARLPE